MQTQHFHSLWSYTFMISIKIKSLIIIFEANLSEMQKIETNNEYL